MVAALELEPAAAEPPARSPEREVAATRWSRRLRGTRRWVRVDPGPAATQEEFHRDPFRSRGLRHHRSPD